tara:strand:- start:1382 stop:1570 length:189 start_codon:yes stop_codon:yes gene_type:complete
MLGSDWDIAGLGHVRVVNVQPGTKFTPYTEYYVKVYSFTSKERVWITADQWKKNASPYYGEL